MGAHTCSMTVPSPSPLPVSNKSSRTIEIYAPISTTAFKVLPLHLIFTNLRSSMPFLVVIGVDIGTYTIAVANFLTESRLPSLDSTCLFF